MRVCIQFRQEHEKLNVAPKGQVHRECAGARGCEMEGAEFPRAGEAGRQKLSVAQVNPTHQFLRERQRKPRAGTTAYCLF